MSENADRGGIEKEAFRIFDGQADPPGGEGSAKMTMRKERYGAFKRSEKGNKTVDPFGHVVVGFAVRRSIAKEIPSRMGLLNFRRCSPFEVAGIPFGEVGKYDGIGLQPGEGAALSSPLQRAHEDMGEEDAVKPVTDFASGRFTARSQRNVRAPRVLTGARPLRFAMTNQIELERGVPRRARVRIAVVPFFAFGSAEKSHLILVFEIENFFKTSAVSFFSGKTGTEKDAHQFPGERVTNDEAPETEKIEIIILDALMSGKGIIDETGPDSAHFVGGDACTDATAADGHPSLHFTRRDGSCQRCHEVRIVVFRSGLAITEVDHIGTGFAEHSGEIFLQLITAVIGGNAHNFGGLDLAIGFERGRGFHAEFVSIVSLYFPWRAALLHRARCRSAA